MFPQSLKPSCNIVKDELEDRGRGATFSSQSNPLHYIPLSTSLGTIPTKTQIRDVLFYPYLSSAFPSLLNSDAGWRQRGPVSTSFKGLPLDGLDLHHLICSHSSIDGEGSGELHAPCAIVFFL